MSEEAKWQDLSIELALNAKKNLDAKDDEITTLRQRLDEKTRQATRWASECKVIRQQLTDAEAQSEALRQELQSQLTAQWKVSVDYAEAFILRKQAEAVEALVSDLPKGNAFYIRAQNEAQRLRQQADEAERAGGEK